MLAIALAVLYAVLVWWVSTGAILLLNRLPRRTHAWSFAGATVLAVAAMAGLRVSSTLESTAGVYLAFTCAIAVWGWQEVAFLLGYITGPRRSPATAALTGWRRAREALQTVLHHELALVVLFVAVVAASGEGTNTVGLWTFVVLWVMRQSAKLNLFLGVPNLFEAFLPPRLKYLHTYFRRAPMNPLLPVSLVLATACAVPLWLFAVQAVDVHVASGLALVAALLSLAILEHAFMVMPLPSEDLWRWAMSTRRAD